MAADVDSDVPDCGAALTFGRSRFAHNDARKFWIKDDPILQIACGAEHTALLTASGRLFTFGSNKRGQLGQGHTNALTKPSCVKALKGERATIVACGRFHTLVATDGGHVYGFGSNSKGQLGSADEQPVHTTPIKIQGLEGVTIKMLSSGADHSLALTDKGTVYVWGSGAEGQIGPEKGHILVPTELCLDSNIICISAGYYHSAFVTVDGKLYTCGQGESGKLGLPDHILKKSPLSVYYVSSFDQKVVWVSCGGNNTVSLTADGVAYSFGNGVDGQLGLGSRLLKVSLPHKIIGLNGVKVAHVSCGENHTAFLTDRGQLYTCGNGRHGKSGEHGLDDYTNQFVPSLVTGFQGFQVQQVACGGSHMMVLAVKQETVTSTHTESNINQESSAREQTRQKCNKLPPLSGISNRNETITPRLPSISKGLVWYVPLRDALNTSSNASDDEIEVLTSIDHHHSAISLNNIEQKDISKLNQQIGPGQSEQPTIRNQDLSLTDIISPLYKYMKDKKCLICGFVSKSSESYLIRRHLAIHLKIKRFKCDKCDRRFSTPTHLRLHKVVHSNDYSWSCNKCGLKFKSKSKLRSHKRKHYNVKTYYCTVCDKKYTSSTSLRIHLRIHTGETPYACSVCNAAFRTSSMHRNHMLTHNEEKLYTCKICKKGYNNRYLLNDHMNSHKKTLKHTCKICEKTFNFKSNLSQHMLVHSDKRKHICETCGMKFKFPHHLRNHILTHRTS